MKIWTIIAYFLAISSIASAEEIKCDEALTIAACMSYRAAEAKELSGGFKQISIKAAEQKYEAKRALSVNTSGDVPMNVLGNEISMNDLLPLLNIAVESGTSGATNEAAGILLEYSPTGRTLGGDLKVSGAFRKPDMASAFKDALGDAEVVKELEDGLDYSDDIEASFTYAFEGRFLGMHIGRSFDLYSGYASGMLHSAGELASAKVDYDPMFALDIFEGVSHLFSVQEGAAKVALPKTGLGSLAEKLGQLALAEGNTAENALAFQRRIAAFSSIDPRVDPLAKPSALYAERCGRELVTPIGKPISNASALDFGGCVVAVINEEIARGVQKFFDRERELNAFLNRNGFFELAKLANNQPQLLLTANARFRDEIAGGDSYSGKFTFEFDISGHNINNLLEHLQKNRNADGATNTCAENLVAKNRNLNKLGSDCWPDIAAYISEKPPVAGGWRGSINIEYVDRKGSSFEVGDDSIPLKLDGGSSIVGSAAFGRQLNLTNSVLPSGKLDLSLAYEDVSDDPIKQDRAFAGLTFTQAVADALQLTIGLVWANKPEYLPDNERELSARVGLNYKFASTENNE